MFKKVKQSHLPLVEKHEAAWKDCTACSLHQSTTQHVFYRGYVPCDVLFITKAPSVHDASIGIPNADDHGRKLDAIIAEAMPNVKVCITPTVCCSPAEGEKPSSVQLHSCMPRLAEFIKLCNPKLVVYVGKIADSAGIKLMANTDIFVRSISINDVSFLSMCSDPEQERIRMVLQLSEAAKRILDGPAPNPIKKTVSGLPTSLNWPTRNRKIKPDSSVP